MNCKFLLVEVHLLHNPIGATEPRRGEFIAGRVGDIHAYITQSFALCLVRRAKDLLQHSLIFTGINAVNGVCIYTGGPSDSLSVVGHRCWTTAEDETAILFSVDHLGVPC